MGKSVSYTINAKDRTKKGINSASSGLSGLNNKLAGVGKMMLAAFSVAAIKKVGQEIQQMQQAFGVQLESELQLQKAVQNSSKMSIDSAKRLKAYASQLQNTSIFGDEQLNQMQAVAVSTGLAEDQVKDLMQASIDLASSGAMPLDGAFKNLLKTYSGTSGKLSELNGDLKGLTTEQLKNGDAVKIMAKQYEGWAETVASGTKGTKQSLENVKGDIQETIGEILLNITGDVNGKLLPIFNKINEWLQGNKTQIVNIFKNIPEIASKVFSLVKNIFGQVFSIEFFKTFASIGWDFFLGFGKHSISVLFEFLKAIGTTIWEPLKYGFQVVMDGIQTGFANMVNFFVEKLNWLITQYNKINFGDDKALMEGMNPTANKPENNISKSIGDAWNKVFDKAKKELPEAFSDVTEMLGEVMNASVDLFGDEFDSFVSDTADVLNKPLEVDFKLDALSDALSDSDGDGTRTKGGGSSSMGGGGILNGILGNMGMFGQALTSSAGWIGMLIQAIMSLINGIKAFSALFNFITTIMDAFIEVVAVPLNKIFAPMVGTLVLLGELLGQMILPTLGMLEPVLKLITAGFIFFYNWALRPLANAIMWVISGLNNAVAYAVNGIIHAINKLPGVNIKWRMAKMDYQELKMDKINEEDIRTAGEQVITDAGGDMGYDTTGGASYSAERDVYITFNIDYQVGISATDDQDLAIKINENLERAKSLGVI